MLEREVKLRFSSPEEARIAILAAGALPQRSRRLQEDVLLDTSAGTLRQRRCALRIRTEPDRSLLTFKGAVQPGRMKTREEHETVVGDGEVLRHVLAELGLTPWFRYQKYREEYAFADLTIALDETPVGTFVEIEGGEQAILAMTAALGRTPDDFILDSYRALFVAHLERLGLPDRDMLFGDE